MQNVAFAVPTSVDEAVAILAEHGDAALPLAGGTDLLAQMKEDRRHCEVVVDIKRIPETQRISFDPKEGLRIGATVSCHETYTHPAVREQYPAVFASASIIGSIQIQNRATLAGNLCNAAPSADAVPALIVLGGTAVVAGPEGRREVPVEEIPIGPGQTSLRPGEFVVELRLPPPAPRSGSHYLRFIPRNEMDIAVAGAGAWVQIDESGETFSDARVALAAVAPVPLRVPAAEEALVGKSLDDDVIRQAAERAAAASRPISDIRGSAAYRRHLVKVLTRRAIQTALSHLE